MAPTLALTRQLSPTIGSCLLTHLERVPIDPERAARQHRAYLEALVALGCEVAVVEPEPELPDAVFVEDTAVVLPELALITRPGAPSRRPETASIARALAPHRPLAALRAPATLDGGDVLVLGRRVFVGLSSRSNQEAVTQLRRMLGPHGYAVQGVPVSGCLHLKSAASRVAEDLLLVQPEWVDPHAFAPVPWLRVDPGEPFAANALCVGDRVLYGAAFPRTRAHLEEHGLGTVTVHLDELAKAEGGVSCCSILVD